MSKRCKCRTEPNCCGKKLCCVCHSDCSMTAKEKCRCGKRKRVRPFVSGSGDAVRRKAAARKKR
jgi:hypothetical protein